MATIYGANSVSGYDVANSLRFDDGSSPYLTRTISSGADVTAFTFSFWLKRSTLGATQRIISSDHTDTKDMYIRFESDDTFGMYHRRTASENVISGFGTAAKFRDTSAWYHFVINMDSNESTEADRLKMYVNGTRVTTFAGTVHYPTSGEYANFFNSSEKTDIGYYRTNNGENFDGYLAEVVAIQGTAYQASSFGEFDSDSPNIWKPKDVSGLTFGTNGFYMEFQQSGTSQNSSGMGADTSGNDNHFATSGLASTDQSTDTCTNNFATFNPLAPTTDITLSENNLKGVYGTSGTRTVQTSTFGLSAGKWYWEVKIGGSASPDNAMVGITQLSTDPNTVLGTADNSWTYRGYDGKVYHNNADEGGSLNTFGDGDIIGIALNLDNLQGGLHKLYFSKNGTFQNSADPTDFTSTTGVYGIDDNVDYFPAVSDAGSSATPQFEINFGSPSFSISSGNSDANGYGNFEYAVPSGFYAINTKNLAKYG